MIEQPGAADSVNKTIQSVKRQCLKFEENQQQNDTKNPGK
jgi:hypothetical protein